MEQSYFTFAVAIIALTALGIFGFIKACDWLIGLKYKTHKECSQTRHEWEKQLREEFAKKEAVQNVKEDIDDMKEKVNKIYDVIMAWAMKDGDK